MVFRFRTSPIEIGVTAASSQSCWAATNWSTTDGRVVAKDTGEREELPAQLVVRAVGYRGVPTTGLPFDEKIGTIPHTDGPHRGQPQRVRRRLDQAGPSGVIGSNKKDSQETVDTLLGDLSGAARADFGEDHSESWWSGCCRGSRSWSPTTLGRSTTTNASAGNSAAGRGSS